MRKLIFNLPKRDGKSGLNLYNRFGGILRCTECGHEQGLSAALVSEYMFFGWPRHCGYTMRWVTQRELDFEADAPDMPDSSAATSGGDEVERG